MLIMLKLVVGTCGFNTQCSSFLYMFEKLHNKKVFKNPAFNEYLINWKMFSAKDNIQNYIHNKSLS